MSAQPVNPGELATVHVPTTLRRFTGGEKEIYVPGDTLGQLIDNLDAQHPGIKSSLVRDGQIAPYVNIHVGGEDAPNARLNDGLDTFVPVGEEIRIIPATAGG